MRLETLIIFPVGKNSYDQYFEGKRGPEGSGDHQEFNRKQSILSRLSGASLHTFISLHSSE